MTSPHHRKLKILTLDIGGTEFQIQCRKAQIVNNTDDGETFYTFGNDGNDDSTSFVEAADPSFALDLEFYSDWRSAGISDYLWDNDGVDVDFQLDLNPDIPAEHVIFNGTVNVKAPSPGGEIRTTDVTAATLQCAGKPAKSRP
jgi:hypothetical protein